MLESRSKKLRFRTPCEYGISTSKRLYTLLFYTRVFSCKMIGQSRKVAIELGKKASNAGEENVAKKEEMTRVLRGYVLLWYQVTMII